MFRNSILFGVIGIVIIISIYGLGYMLYFYIKKFFLIQKENNRENFLFAKQQIEQKIGKIKNEEIYHVSDITEINYFRSRIQFFIIFIFIFFPGYFVLTDFSIYPNEFYQIPQTLLYVLPFFYFLIIIIFFCRLPKSLNKYRNWKTNFKKNNSELYSKSKINFINN
jgi:hypothetical protein